jgi:hypothetical protein
MLVEELRLVVYDINDDEPAAAISDAATALPSASRSSCSPYP